MKSFFFLWLFFLFFQPPGDPEYDKARILNDSRSIRKLQLLDSHKDRNYESEKWFHTVIEDENKNKNSNLSNKFSEKTILLNNNTENIKKDRKSVV